MFVDTARVKVIAGKGGDGAVSFRREIYIDKGGPDGGDGGKGGDVIFMADKNKNTLLDFRYKPELKSKPGSNGSKQLCRGASGDDLIVRVPVGTIVRREGTVVADLTHDGQKLIVAYGGDGGFGNAHFKSSVRQTPRMAELGEAGDSFEADLELKLLADVGLVGFPNAGKSTFLSVVSNARPEIANYAFTTLTPNLGVAKVDDGQLLIADIPGLIEGASEGKGLGDAFLRHVERTAVLLHLVDIYANDVAKQYTTIREELRRYSSELAERPEVIALTKIEGLDKDIVDMQIKELQRVAGDSANIFAISASAHQGVVEVLRELRTKVQEERKTQQLNSDIENDDLGDVPVITLDDSQQNTWECERISEDSEVIFVVRGKKIEKFARRTNTDQFEAVNRLRDIMKKMGISHELARMGAVGESVIRIGQTEITFIEQ